MAKKESPFVDTKDWGYSLLIPSKQCNGDPAIYKVYFGSRYLVWKGRSFSQSCDLLAKSISAGLNKVRKGDSLPEEHQMCHVVKHIISGRVTSGKVELLCNDFIDEFGSIKGIDLLKEEQRALDAVDGDPLCLNNNEQAYVPINNTWISEADKNKFLKWYANRR